MRVEAMMTTKQIADEADTTVGALRVLAHRGRFIEPAMKVGSVHLYHRRDYRAWKRERDKRRESK